MLHEFWIHSLSVLINAYWVDALFNYFIPIGIIAVLTALIFFELSNTPTGPSKRSLLMSYRTNAALFVGNNIILSLLSATTLFALAEQYSTIGLFDSLAYPLQWLAALLALDLMLYSWHRACHRFNILWMFHKVHHSDLSLNTTTSFRVHCLELFLTTLLKAAFILLTGVDVYTVTVCESITVIATLYHHAQITSKFDTWLSRILISPGLHRLHHSRLRKQHDNNYGAIFSIWDRVFGSLLILPPDTINIGLKNIKAMNVAELVCYGLTPDGVEQPAYELTDLNHMIEEAAYYRAERHGFSAGRELNDWLAAESEITHSLQKI